MELAGIETVNFLYVFVSVVVFVSVEVELVKFPFETPPLLLPFPLPVVSSLLQLIANNSVKDNKAINSLSDKCLVKI